MKRAVQSLLLWSLLAALPVWGAPDVSLETFRYVRQAMRIADEGDRFWYVIDYDSSLYETLDNLSTDLRLVRPDRQTVPFAVERQSWNTRGIKEEYLPGKFTGVQTLPDGRAAVEFELETAADRIASLELVTPETDFHTILSVAVGDGGNWETALPESTFQDYPQLNLTSRRLVFARPMRGRIIRLIFGESGGIRAERALKIDSLRVFRSVTYELPGVPQLTAAPLTEIAQSHEDGRSVLTYRSDRAPLAQLKITSASSLYQRRVTLSGSDNQRVWTPISGGTVKRIDSDMGSTLELPESRYKFYRLEIQNGVEPPLETIQVNAQSASYRLILPGQFAVERLLLYYGGKANRPDSDLRGYGDFPPAEPPGRYALGKLETNPLWGGQTVAKGSSRWILSTLLLLGAGVLLYGILRSLRKIDATLPAD